MKKQFAVTAALILLEQSIKLWIWNFALDWDKALLLEGLRLRPMQNTNLAWIASMGNFTMPVALMVVLQWGCAAALILYCRYEICRYRKVSPFLLLGFCAGLAGITCSFIDVVFWGGSLDYIYFFGWFTFDLKDVFLHTGWIGIIIWEFRKIKKYPLAVPVAFKEWVRRRCPVEMDGGEEKES